jgi:hypothetical protein
LHAFVLFADFIFTLLLHVFLLSFAHISSFLFMLANRNTDNSEKEEEDEDKA